LTLAGSSQANIALQELNKLATSEGLPAEFTVSSDYYHNLYSPASGRRNSKNNWYAAYQHV